MTRPATPTPAAFRALIGHSPYIPVVAIERVADAVPLARALLAGGLTSIEITLRTPHALDAIAAVSAGVPGIVVGAGTIISPSQIGEAVDAGAQFLVSPGATPRLAQALGEGKLPALPGIATVSEALALAGEGFEVMKFFPAEASGGIPFLRHVLPVLPKLTFCPTGGVDLRNAASYLALANVVCVGGASVAPAAMITAGDFAGITRLSAEAAQLRT